MENELVIMKDQQAVTTSLKVAEVFEKNHRDVMRSIKNLTAQNCAVGSMFVESTYVNQQNHEQPMYYMNRDGFSLLVMGFTGQKALDFKLKYIKAFNKMEAYIKQQQGLPQTPEEKLNLTMEVTVRLDKRVSQTEKDIKFLKETSEINSAQRYELESLRKKRVMKLVGGADSNYYREKHVKKVFSKISSDFHKAFHISRYEDLKKKDFEAAKKYIKNWYPPYDLKQEIDAINAQETLTM
ncbi:MULTISPECIES: Rha family transcriptional regulator [Lactobacillus]|uniref:Phage regulatory protein n=1 Tax=Lactobacillus xujianguonis TaxID=2495899 RepID=A0A437SSJ7_9LACO|nr:MULTISPECIES: Rha family transcriptional regulator [Lactobacillus]RVU69834.1 phage regulatory protein [Lactobacillus xujianguonis]RVU77443.1 phage regulatory protein [Lactobacillus xujianguonis]